MLHFPNSTLKFGLATDLVKQIGLKTLHEVAHWVWRLPYGRTSDRSNYLLLPQELRGACSGKHAFLAKVAEETDVALRLHIGIFMMNRENTPQIKATLDEVALLAIPEAHCFLKYKESNYDFTRYTKEKSPELNASFLVEQEISPEQIGEYKVNYHRNWLRNWAIETNQSLSFDELWSLRERCILALS